MIHVESLHSVWCTLQSFSKKTIVMSADGLSTLRKLFVCFVSCFLVQKRRFKGDCLTHFTPIFDVYTPWRRQKTRGFLTFSGVVEMENFPEMGLHHFAFFRKIQYPWTFCHCSLSISPTENFRKPEVFWCFQGV